MAITFVAAGADSGTNGGSAPTPGLPAGLLADDLMVTFFYSRETVDGTVSISAGWTQIYNERSTGGLFAAWYRFFVAGDLAPTFTLTGHVGGAVGDTAISQIAAWRGVDTADALDATGTLDTNVSQADIGPISGISLAADDAVLVLGGRADNWGTNGVDTLTGDGLTWAEIGEPNYTVGADAGLVWDYAINGGSPVTVTAKTFNVLAGANVGKGAMFSLNVAGAAAAPPTRTLTGVGR